MTNETKENKLAKSMSAFMDLNARKIYNTDFTWLDEDVDRFEIEDDDDYKNIVATCRFFYKHDPIASTVINKLVDIGVSRLEFFQGSLTPNEFKIFLGIRDEIQTFLEDCALEYLLSGLVIPEISYTAVGKEKVKELGYKKAETLVLPTDMSVRDSATITINKVPVSSKSSYFVQIPDDLYFFIHSRGTYQDGTKDPKLFQELLSKYPDFVAEVLQGNHKILLENPLVIERRKTADSAYPIPYLYPAIESLKHKRNLRKMDYSIASRVISAIQLFTLGDKDFPLTETDNDQILDLKEQVMWRDGTSKNVERIFQLFGNHTLKISWIFPPTEALLDEVKYKSVNADIFNALGFPKILVTGESERTGTSDPEYALLSPIKTMENMQQKLFKIVKSIVENICKYNNIPRRPTYKFSPVNLHDFIKHFEALTKLYETGNLSREDYAASLGFDIETQLEKRRKEQEKIEETGLEEFSPVPHSNTPLSTKTNTNQEKTNEE